MYLQSRAQFSDSATVPYAWDEPTLDHYLTLAVMNGTTATYDLDKIGEGEQLIYENYHFICATVTTPR